MRFTQRPAWIKRFASRSFIQTHTGQTDILLTFDDGPHPQHTPAVLQRLQTHGFCAAFFLVGQRIAQAPHLPHEIVRAGHVIGNHTYSHARFGLCDREQSESDVKRCQELLPEATHFRPPFGRITPGLWFAARSLGLISMNWSLDSGDWRCRSAADAQTCAHQVLENVQPGDIVLMHDDHSWIEHILDVLLPALAKRSAHKPACRHRAGADLPPNLIV